MKDIIKDYIKNRFKIIKILRKNDKGEVQLAQLNDTGEFVIIKKINFTGLPYKILRKNPHKLFAKILKCAEDSEDTLIIEEFIQGEPLMERILNKKFLNEYEAKEILLQICDGLKFLHKLGIIHRDIKPSNLILQADGVVKLIDFDAARIFKENQSEDTNSLGTKGYAPPEQYGYGQTDSRSDIYALGITFQKLLGENYHGNLEKILSKCTEIDPKNRFQNVDELKFAIINQKNSVEKSFNPLKIILLTIIIFIFYNIFNENQPENVPEEKIPEPEVEIEKVEEIPAPKEEYKFPEINLPPIPNINFEEKVEPLPEIENNLPEIENKPPKIIKNPEPFQKENSLTNANYVKVEYFLDGERLHAWIDEFDLDIKNIKPAEQFEISYNEWKNYEKVSANSTAVKFSNSVIEVYAKNFSKKTLKNPELEIIFDNNGRIEKKTLRGKEILPNEAINFKIPLNQFQIDNPNYKIKNMFFDNMTLKFRGEGAEIRGSNAYITFHFEQN